MDDPGYVATLERLRSLSRHGVHLGLERMERTLDRLGSPQRAFPSLHVAGTNGKGSTSAMLDACLRRAGLRTGLYTSPHLCRFTERIQVDGREIARGALSRYVDRALAVEPALTFFEAATVAAFCCFAEERVEIAVVETGLGGRLDATNVITPLVSVITRLGLDHTELLGLDLASVAREKAGILKPGVPALSAPAAPEAERVVSERASALGCRLRVAGRDFSLVEEEQRLVYRGAAVLDGLRLALAGDHQRENAALCLAALEELRAQGRHIPDAALREGLAAVRWPGRLEQVDDRHLLDGAHNPDGARALARALGERRDLCLVVGILGPKDPRPVLEPLLPHAGRVVFTRPRSERAIPPEELAPLVPGAATAVDLAAALDLLRDDGRPRLVTGSLYLVGEARSLLLGEPCDPLPTADPIRP
jgi:dihydrofolate synthase / folylpolyglutamate synthase